jgi:hypothetical protein
VRDVKALRCQIRYSSFEYSGSSVLDDTSRNSDGDPKLLNVNRNDDSSWLNTNYDKSDNKWNRDGGFAFVVSQLSSFLLRLFGGGVLFYKLSAPAPEHTADFIDFFR